MKKNRFNKDFLLVVIGQIISILGSAMLRFALNLYVLDITGRADIFAIVIAVSTIPGIIFSPIGGAVADRFNRRNLMVIFDFSSSAVVLILILLMSASAIPISIIVVILTILAVISFMYHPAVQASVPTLVSEEQLAGANGIVNGVGSLAGLLGPVLGGILYGIIGLKTLVIMSCIAFSLSAIMEMFIKIPFTKRISGKHIVSTIFDDIKDGFTYIGKSNPVLLKIIFLASLINMILTPLFIIGLPYVLRVVMKSSDMMYGVGLGILELSAITGALSTGILAKRLKISNVYISFLIISILLLPMALSVTSFFLGFGYWIPFILFFSITFIVVFLMTAVSVFIVTDVQKITPNEMLGKIMAIMMAASHVAAPLGQILYGYLFQALHNTVYVPVLTASVFTAVIALIAKRALREKKA